MKKFIIGVVFIIPILVVLAISATGQLIAGAKHVNATTLSIRNEFNEEIDNSKPLIIDMADDYAVIYIDVLPAITYDKSLVTELIEDDSHKGEVKLNKDSAVENKYYLVPVMNGSVRLVIRAANNREVYKALEIYVRSDKAEGMYIYNSNGETVNNNVSDEAPEIAVTSPENLGAYAFPYDTTAQNAYLWGSDNEEIAVVDASGTVFPQNRGKARIWVSIVDNTGNRLTRYLTVNTRDALVKRVEVKTFSEISESWIRENVVIAPNADIIAVGGDIYKVTDGANSVSVKVSAAENGDWDIYGISDILYVNMPPATPFARYVDFTVNSTPAVRFSVVNGSGEAYFTNGILNALSPGDVTVFATDGTLTREKKVTIKEFNPNFSLALNAEDAELGIEMTRVWGLKWFDESGGLTSTYKFGCTLNENSAKVHWSSDNTDFATVSDDAYITFYPESCGKSVTISAALMVDNFVTQEKRSFTFIMTDSPDAINIDGDTALATSRFYEASVNIGVPAVLQNSVSLKSDFRPKSDIYGNGFIISAKERTGLSDWSAIIDYTAQNFPEGTKVMIRNVTIEAAENYESSMHRGTGIRADGMKGDISIMYCCIRFLHQSLQFRDNGGESLVQGCILGDSILAAATINYNPPVTEKIIFRNNVLKETSGPSIFATHDAFSSDIFNEVCNPIIVIDGFMDMYNWKTPIELKGLLSAMSDGLFNGLAGYLDPEVLKSALGNFIEQVFFHPSMSRAAYSMIGPDGTETKYVCIGMLALGCYIKVDESKIIVNDNGIEMVEVKLPKDNTSLGNLVALFDGIVKAVDPKMTVRHSLYSLSYNLEKDGGPRNKPGDPVPQNTELYTRLKYGLEKNEK